MIRQPPKSSKLSKFLNILQLIFLSLTILLVLISLALNPFSSIYEVSIDSNADAYIYGTLPTKAFTSQIVTYLWTGHNYNTKLSEQAQTHLQDVRQLFIYGQIFLAICLLLLAFLYYKKTFAYIIRSLRAAAIIDVCVVIVISLFSVFFFEPFFELFHKLLFSNDLWLFPASDSLIQFFPHVFFQSIFIQLGLWIIICCILFLFFSRNQSSQRVHSGKLAQHI